MLMTIYQIGKEYDAVLTREEWAVYLKEIKEKEVIHEEDISNASNPYVTEWLYRIEDWMGQS